MAVCLVAMRLCTLGGLWTELCVWLQWDYVLLEGSELNCVSVLRWGYVLLEGSELNCVSGCKEVMYCWRFVNWTVCLVAMRLCTAGGFWSELCVCLRWGYVLLAVCELNCVSGCGEVIYCWRVLKWTPLWHSSSKLKREVILIRDYNGKKYY